MKITKNLSNALVSLRRPYESRLLWVDALCINQDDVEERSQQVSIMGRIYKEARMVLVYLGEEWSGVDSVCEYIELAAQRPESHFVTSLKPHLQVSMIP